ncbi:MAG: hypothetical protein NT154_29795 [Verrucomicrobia bacterium]|nr:hypothetical protein [Verrucomicrobiota bacterium]
MTKQQMIWPVVALLVVGLVSGVMIMKRQHRRVIGAASLSVGRDLIATTNSTHLVRFGPHLRGRLSELLRSPTHVSTVRLGDVPPPEGDGKACSRLVLTNNAGQRLLIRLRQVGRPGMFEVLGFRNVSE